VVLKFSEISKKANSGICVDKWSMKEAFCVTSKMKFKLRRKYYV